MLSYFTRKSLTEDDPSSSMTNEERERLKILEHERELAFDKFYRCGRLAEPSLVLDDFLFLGNIQHATNQSLLERFGISSLIFFFLILLEKIFFLEHILNVCDMRLEQRILDKFNVVHISMPDIPKTNIKQV